MWGRESQSRGGRGIVWVLAAVALAMIGVLAPTSASAEVQYGTLSNFDTFNDTEEETHGFEIELDGISSSDISYEFGAPYERYGNPKLIDFPGGVYVRYESPWDPVKREFTQGTPVAPTPITPTLGHQCWTGGSAEYLTSGCEHFGLGLIANPTKVAYHWLVADPAKPGNLIESATKVSLPAPEWKVVPPSPEHPVGGVVAAVEAPEPEAAEFGEAEWVKEYVTESPKKAQLNNLLSGNPEVPEEASQTETEWILLQKEFGNPKSGVLESEKQLEAGDESVTRRYEIYKYTGKYNAESHEAEPKEGDSKPAEGELGEYLGAQMAALNIEGGEPAPTVTKLSTKKGPAAGRTTVTITGTGFTGASAVRFGSSDALSFKVNSATSITAESPPGTTGKADVKVTTSNGTNGAVAGDVFTYGKPTVTGVSPSGGPVAGGTNVTVTGSGFTPGAGATTLKFGKALGTSVECPSSTMCMVLAPPAKKAGTVDVTAKSAGKSSAKSPSDHYAYS